jgi:hypothetical protein
MTTLALGLLETIVVSSKATSVVSSIGTNLIITTITNTTSSITNMISYLTTSSQPGLKEILNVITDCDLEFTINIIRQLVEEQKDTRLNESIKKALIGVSNILDSIYEELNSVKKAIELHNSKYFNNWRSFEWSGNIENIKRHNIILTHRYTLLFELLKIYSKN